jgi:hypothetical protein
VSRFAVTRFATTRGPIIAITLGVLVGCGSGAVATIRPGTNASPTNAPTATAGGGPINTAGLCGVFGEALAIAALGGPVAAPTGGDVVPRGNGIYCHYAAAGNANVNVEAQLKDMTREEFEALATTLGATTPLPGVGEVAFARPDSSMMGGSGSAVAAWSGGRGVTVSINRAGEETVMLAAAKAIAAAVLLANP